MDESRGLLIMYIVTVSIIVSALFCVAYGNNVDYNFVSYTTKEVQINEICGAKKVL